MWVSLYRIDIFNKNESIMNRNLMEIFQNLHRDCPTTILLDK